MIIISPVRFAITIWVRARDDARVLFSFSSGVYPNMWVWFLIVSRYFYRRFFYVSVFLRSLSFLAALLSVL